MMDALQVHKINKHAFGNGQSEYLVASTHPLPGNPISYMEVYCGERTYIHSNLKLAYYLTKYTGVYSIYLGWYTEEDYTEAFKW